MSAFIFKTFKSKIYPENMIVFRLQMNPCFRAFLIMICNLKQKKNAFWSHFCYVFTNDKLQP